VLPIHESVARCNQKKNGDIGIEITKVRKNDITLIIIDTDTSYAGMRKFFSRE
jgi:hypothetical protein